MENVNKKKGKKKKKPNKTSNQPTDLKFWKQINKLTNSMTTPSTSPNIRPQIRPGVPSQNVRPGVPSHNVRPGAPGQNTRPGVPAQNIRPGSQGTIIRYPIPTKQVSSANKNETIFQEHSGFSSQKSTKSSKANTVRTVISIQPSDPEQSTTENSSQLQPNNPMKFIPPSLRGKVTNQQTKSKQDGSDNQPNKLTISPDQGSKFNILPVMARTVKDEKQTTSSATVSNLPSSTPSNLNNNDSPVIILVGKTEKMHPMNQQKKILKFQMKLQAIQQEKQRQMNNLQTVTTSKEHKFVNTFVSTSTANDMHNPVGTTNLAGTPNPAGMANPAGMPNPSGMPNPASLTNFANMPNPAGIPNPVGVPHPARMTNRVLLPNPGGVQPVGIANSNPSRMQKPTGVPAPSRNTQPKTLISVPVNNPTPAPAVKEPEIVETVFGVEQGTTNANVKQKKHLNTRVKARPWLVTTDQNGYVYPKGIPKSFLVPQQLSQPGASDAPIWPSYQPNMPMGQSPTNNPNTASPLLVQTDSQGEVAQPYSPSELYTDLEITTNQDAEALKTAITQAAKTKQDIDYWELRLQEALHESKLKHKIWAQHNKAENSQYHLDYNTSLTKVKDCRRMLKLLRKSYAKECGDVQRLSLTCEDSESSEVSQTGQKRVSAFCRLGPQTQPKKPKLTISVTVNDDQEVREVVDETEDQEEIAPVHLREDMILSTDETVMKYLKSWPWKRNVVIKRSVTARNSKTVMMLEREQMEEIYDKETLFVQVSVKGYPPTWKKEQVLDLLMENIRGYSFIPCFIEFTHEECKFLTLRCRSALLSLHKCGFIIRKEDVELIITLGQTELTLAQLDFVPRLILRKRLNMCVESSTKLDLSEFTLREDISHFIYYPLSRLDNQSEIIQVQCDVNWTNLTVLNLSHNRISCLDGFDLEQTTPKLKHLNLSYNCIEKLTHLLKCRQLPLRSIHLEGNPLCTDYIDPDYYMKVVKMMFSGVMIIDDIPVKFKGEMPKTVRNYCPSDAKELVEKFLEVYFPLLHGDIEHRVMLQDMYEDNATMTITFNYKMAFSPIYRCFKTLFQNARILEQNKMDMIKGSSAIVKNIASWPFMDHDPFTFTVDVLHHTDSTTILRIDGILKLTRETLAEDEYLLAFSRTLVLHTRDFVEYKIQTEMIHWSTPTGPYARMAFAVTAVKTKQMNPKIDSTTDEKLQAELLKIFMKLTSMDKKISERCLEIKKWNLKEALDHFTKLLKLDSLETLSKAIS